MTHGLSDGTAEISAPENGWRFSRYNLFCPLPESDCTIIANLYRGTLTFANELEMYLLSVYERLDVNHPIITRFARRGILVDFDELAALDAAACRSGNSLTVLLALVHQNFSSSPAVPAGDEKQDAALAARYDAVFFAKARTNYCGADLLSSICVDPKGNLFKCWETVDKQEYRFAGARTFDPLRFKETSDQPEMLMRFIDHAALRFDPECRACVWLPACAGGCPLQGLRGKRACPAYRDEPELYVKAVYDYLHSQKSQPGENHANT